MANIKAGLSEAQHQQKLMQWTQQPSTLKKYPELSLLFHIPNGGKRNPREAKHLKEQGVKAGVPDLCLPVARHGYNGLFIEMKKDKGKATNKQKCWLDELRKQGYYAAVCHSWQEAQKLLIIYLRKSLTEVNKNGEKK